MKQVAIAEAGIELNGLPWFAHNGNKLWRLPVELQGQVSDDLWACSKCTSGARLRFASRTSTLGIAVDYSPYDTNLELANMDRLGQAGIDLYGDGRFWKNVVPAREAEIEGMFFEGLEPCLRQYTIYLPLYHHLEIKYLLFADDADLLPPAPFALPKPVVFYGTSITQGGCASRPGLSYQAMLCRKLNLDFVNLGFSGLGKGEPEVAQAIAQLDAACFVLDYAQNNPTVEEFQTVYQPFLSIIREAHPETPIILTTPIRYTHEEYSEEDRDFQERRRDVVREAYRAGREQGDAHLYLIEGNELLADGDGQVDGGHPNDLGFSWMARRMQVTLEQALAV